MVGLKIDEVVLARVGRCRLLQTRLEKGSDLRGQHTGNRDNMVKCSTLEYHLSRCLLPGHSLAIQCLRLCAFSDQGPGSIPGLGPEIPQAGQGKGLGVGRNAPFLKPSLTTSFSY